MRFSSNCIRQTCVNKEELLTLNKFVHDCQANATQKRVDIINTIWNLTYYCFCIIINLILAQWSTLLSCRKQRFYNLNRWSYSVFVAAHSMLYLCLPFELSPGNRTLSLQPKKDFTAQSYGLFQDNWIVNIEQVLCLKSWIKKWPSFAQILLVLYTADN